jgi:hypothetical protein
MVLANVYSKRNSKSIYIYKLMLEIHYDFFFNL